MGLELKVECVRDLAGWESLRSDWNELAQGIPFREWDWYDAWWRHYRPTPGELCVVTMRNQAGSLCGAVPWYTDWTLGQGQALRFLGSGKVCSDFATILAVPEQTTQVCRTLWSWLNSTNVGTSESHRPPAWDLIELEGVVEDSVVDEFVAWGDAHCETKSNQRELESCWELAVPKTWDEYVSSLDKRYRQKVRGVMRRSVETGDAQLRLAENEVERTEMLAQLTDLHQRRRATLGQEGCFSCSMFTNFIHDVCHRFASQGRLVLASVCVGSEIAGVGLGFKGSNALYLYQCGMEPALSQHQPGWLLNLLLLRECQRQQIPRYNLLRGDEPYKSHLGAVAQKCYRIRIAPGHGIARLRHEIWEAGAQLRGWLTTGWASVQHE